MLQSVKTPAARYWIAGSGDTDAFPEGAARKPGESKVRYHPAIGNLIVENNGVTLVFVRTTRSAVAQGSKERIERSRTRQGVAVFVKNLESLVHCLYVVIWANVTICVRRHLHAALRKASSLKRQQRRRHHGNRPQNFHDPSRQLCKARRIYRWRSCLDPRIRDQALIQNLWSWRNVRQLPQVRVHANRTHQGHNVRPITRICCSRR